MRGRSLVAVVLAVAAGCVAADDRKQRNGGGPGGPSGGGPDARASVSVDAGDGRLHGTVCVADDLHAPLACATHAGAGLIVTEKTSGATATTAADGTFALEVGGATSALLDIGTGGDKQLVPAIARVAVTGAIVQVPVVSGPALDDLEAALGTVVPDGSGSIALYLIDAHGAGRSGFAVTPPPGTVGGPFYDDQSAIGWDAGGTTGAIGGALMFGVPAGSFDVAVSRVGTQATVTAVPVVGGHVTFVTAVP